MNMNNPNKDKELSDIIFLSVANVSCTILKPLPPYILGILSASYDILSTTLGLSPPIATPFAHMFSKAITASNPDMKESFSNKKIAIGNVIVAGMYSYYQYGEPVRNYLDNIILFG